MQSKAVLAAIAAAGLLLGGTTALAASKKATKAAEKKDDTVIVSVKPPSGQWEAKPDPANGHIWRAGYYEWTGERFQWKPGEWILDKEGFDFVQYKWVEKGTGKWELVGGDWVKETAGR